VLILKSFLVPFFNYIFKRMSLATYQRLLSKGNSMGGPFTSTLTNAPAIVVDDATPLHEALASIGLRPPYPTLAIVGGVNIDNAHLASLRALFFNVLAPLAQECQAAVVDGGTNGGIMGFMGQARASIDGTFPLVGVLPADKILASDSTPDLELESHHTHFVLSPGKEWGDESLWLARVASELSGDAPSLTLLANGGDIAWRDVAASLAQGRPVVVMAGSGRTADILAENIRGHAENQQLTRAFAASGLLHVFDINNGTHALTQGLRSLLKLNLVEEKLEIFTGKGLRK
jgi:hypothetical protein